LITVHYYILAQRRIYLQLLLRLASIQFSVFIASFPEFDAHPDCCPKIIVAHFVPELIPPLSSFNFAVHGNRKSSRSKKKAINTQGGGEKVVAEPKSGLYEG